jgi:acetylornithine deacetylase/succinyl-diaminopimelate desuccinylase-like protein
MQLTGLDEYADKTVGEGKEFDGQLRRLVSIPSLSKEEKHRADLRRVQEAMAEIAGGMGFETWISDDEFPILIAKLQVNPSLPWVTVYNHMDVQPAEEPEWETEPFQPTVKDGKLLGRGSTDDKGPALSVLHAVRFLRSQDLPMPNIQLLYETEEESGSTHFASYLAKHRDRMEESESVLVSDTIFEGEHPAISYKLRGSLDVAATLRLGEKEIHSGVYGGGVHNPVNVLNRALAAAENEDGRILIPGFYDDVMAVEGRELEEFQRVCKEFDIAAFRQASGRSLVSDDPAEILRRTLHQPTFEILGYDHIHSGEDRPKSAVPCVVTAKLSVRTVAHQRPERLRDVIDLFLQAKVRELLGHDDFELTVTGEGPLPFLVEVDNPFVDQANAACTAGFGRAPLYVACGGTIGALPPLQDRFPGAPVVCIAQSLLEDGYHEPNESFRFDQARGGIRTMAHYLHNIAELRMKKA